MGGGSADGATVLRLLYEFYGKPFPEETLYNLAEQTGSDVPFALFGGTALAREKGQVLTRISSLPPCHIVLCKPNFPISTPELFRAVDQAPMEKRPDTAAMVSALEAGNLSDIAKLLCNVFQPIVSSAHPELLDIRDTLVSSGALGASMTGSGPTMFGIFQLESQANAAYSTLCDRYPETFLTKPV